MFLLSNLIKYRPGNRINSFFCAWGGDPYLFINRETMSIYSWLCLVGRKRESKEKFGGK
ncbi:hypothetical protein PanWU01x14_313030 [Parasponia andersonii]|uniref:Uncharacterized protein n=1 Tax=Parasponia andersonii TaxID=3476 RepID=A0A2P5AP86_PARAD|nr:hypothetical protein PanWU01x14_313030 [Parasponia andersonii]